MNEVMQGIFAVMQTPLRENGELDVKSLER